MKEIVRLAVFLGFLGLGARVACAGPASQRQRVNALLIYVLCMSSIAGLAQRDLWPFAAYRIFYHAFFVGHVFERTTLRLVGPLERECEPDPRFPAPLTLPVLLEWLDRTYPRLPEPGQEEVMKFLLTRARETGEAAVAPRRPAIARLLTAVAPPVHWALYARSSPDDFLRCVPYTGLRLYHDEWRLGDTLQDSRRVTRHLVSEYRSP